MLTIILDSLSIDTNFSKKYALVEDLLSRDPSLFRIYRTSCAIDEPRIKEISSLPKIYGNQFNGKKLEKIYQNLLFHPKNPCQEQFFFCIIRYAHQKDNPDYIHDSVYVTENPIFFEKYLRGGKKANSLRDFFPNLILVNLDRMKEVLDYYEIKEGHYYFNRVRLNLKEEWQYKTLFFNLPSLSGSFIKYQSNNDMVELLKSLAFRFRKLYYCTNSIGIEHYFGNLKEVPIDPVEASSSLEALKRGN